LLGPELQGGAKARTGVAGIKAGETMARVKGCCGMAEADAVGL
jgi:hypothetical protein